MPNDLADLTDREAATARLLKSHSDRRRLADAGFSIVPTDELPPASRASHYSG